MKKYLNFDKAYTSLAKKIFINVIFYIYFKKKGGEQFHYLLKNSDKKITIIKNTSIKTIFYDNISLFDDIKFNANIIKNYISNVNINTIIKENYLIILSIFDYSCNQKWKKNIFKSFINCCCSKFGITKESIFSNNNDRLIISDSISLSDFIQKYFAIYLIKEKTTFRGLFYSHILYALKFLNEKHMIKNINFDNYFKKEKISEFKIPFQNDEFEYIYCYRIILTNLPTIAKI